MLEAKLFDLDGVVFSNTTPLQTGALSKYFRVNPHKFIAPVIPEVDRTVDRSRIMLPNEMTKFATAALRSVSLDTWEFLWNTQATVIGNSGRPNKPVWTAMTYNALDRANLATRFADIYFRPRKMSGIQSKGAALAETVRKYDAVEFYDDDPWVIFGLSRKFPKKDFPQVQFFLVQPISAGDLMIAQEREQFPNVTRIAHLKVAEPEPVFVPHEHDPNAEPSYFTQHALSQERAPTSTDD